MLQLFSNGLVKMVECSSHPQFPVPSSGANLNSPEIDGAGASAQLIRSNLQTCNTSVGIAGGQQKCSIVKEELGFDACLNHRQPELSERLEAACPNGIDIYFENVGGPVLDAVLLC